jgi:two-component system response regulator PilR (NtrC family)
VLESKTFRRLGGTVDITVDTRVVAATNRDLKKEVENQRFREDLYFRLQVIPIEVPPLRARKSDIALLVRHFLERFAREVGKGARQRSIPRPSACSRATPGRATCASCAT